MTKRQIVQAKKTKTFFSSSNVNQKNLPTKNKQDNLNRWRIAQLLMLGF